MSVTIPEAAMPVVKILRRDVERPTAKIWLSGGNRNAPRFECGKCPQGLHNSALVPTPATPESFTAGSPLALLNRVTNNTHDAGYVFWTWWDSLTLEQAYEAVDLIWPTEQVAQ